VCSHGYDRSSSQPPQHHIVASERAALEVVGVEFSMWRVVTPLFRAVGFVRNVVNAVRQCDVVML